MNLPQFRHRSRHGFFMRYLKLAGDKSAISKSPWDEWSAEYLDLKAQLIDYGARSFILGRAMVDQRERMGEETFKHGLATECPDIPWTDAEMCMDNCLSSPLARMLDKKLDNA